MTGSVVCRPVVFGREKNMNNKSFLLGLIVLFGSVFCGNILAWDNDVTHKDLSKYAAENSVLSKGNGDYLENLGINNALDEYFLWDQIKYNIKDWLREGAELEDAGRTSQMICGYGRSFNHFHNPLNPWDRAGLNGDLPNLCPPFIPPIRQVTGESSMLWAQDSASQATYTDLEGDWSWETVREYFYSALTGEDFNGDVKASTQLQRKEYFARTFKGLGHQMHLVQDKAVPDHVRNDAHPEDAFLGKNPLNGSAYFETWTKEAWLFIRCLLEAHASLPPNIIAKCQKYGINESVDIDNYYPAVSFAISYNSLAPITQLFDSEVYNGVNPSNSLTQGLAEYTNANFFSGDTIFAAERYSVDHRHYFPYPKTISTDLYLYLAGSKPMQTVTARDGSQDTGIWISKTNDGEEIQYFVRTSKLTKFIHNLFGEGELFYKTFYRDEKCHEDYASKLIPRAVGYSAGLLNYFFRGLLEISAPDQYVYAITDGNRIFPYIYTDEKGNTYQTQQQLFGKIKAKVLNMTPKERDTEGNVLSYEDIVSGSLIAVARYKIIPNYSPDLGNYPPDGAMMMNDIGYRYSVSLPVTLTPEQAVSLNIQPTEFTFDFTGNEIPAGITDLTLQVIFKGTLGNETDIAVSVGMRNLMEPTHQVFWNLTDMFSIEGHLYTAEQIMANPDLLSRTNGAYINPHPITLEISYMPESPPAEPIYASARVTDLPDGRYIRVIVLADDELTYPYVRMAWHVELPDREPEDGDNDYYFETVINQDYGGTWYAPTEATLFRTIQQHFEAGVLRCEPLVEDPVTGNHYCAYPEEEAIIPLDLSPYPAEVLY